MDREQLIGSAATGLIGFSLGFASAALYDGLIRFPAWERSHNEQSIVLYTIAAQDATMDVSWNIQPSPQENFTQMEPSWPLYMYLPAAGAIAAAAGFAITHLRRRESSAPSLASRVSAATP
jgi:hypothetical protein